MTCLRSHLARHQPERREPMDVRAFQRRAVIDGARVVILDPDRIESEWLRLAAEAEMKRQAEARE